MLQLYQQDDKKDQPATSILKQNDIVLVKEPYFKVMANGQYGLCVDHVSGLVRVESCDKRVPGSGLPGSLAWIRLRTIGMWKEMKR